MKNKLLVGLVVMVLLVGVLSGCIEEEPVKTEANFEYTSDDMYVGTEFIFEDKSTGEGLTYEWDFNGDDVVDSTEQNPTYLFDTAGTYNVKLTITDNEGTTSEYTAEIIIVLKDIVITAIDAGFSTLATALTTALLVDTLQGDGPFTVFAPTDDAFAEVNQTWLTALLDDVTNLTKVLTYHVVSGTYMSIDLTNTTVESLEGSSLTITVNESGVYVDDIMVSTADVECSNGVIHIIDSVLIPETVTGPTE
ncbi:MAG: fasciclin domain-containing protein [Thermoplasmatales archaeon]|nr:MAG: fasciclin domain-containing protein [Thermoplasmatales archaeon]